MSRTVTLRRDLPPEIPDDVDDPGVTKASGTVTLPRRINWSDADPTYDLQNALDRRLVYEQVMTEGTAEDVRRFIDVDVVIELWHDLMLPRAVSKAWSDWLAINRAVTLRDWRDSPDQASV